MANTIFEEMGGTYWQEGDYLLPNLTVPESTPLGIWGQCRRTFLREHRQTAYTAMLITGILEDHLATTDQQAKKMFFQLEEQMTKLEGVTEQLKTYSQLEWIQCMNNIKNRAMEIVNTELITI